MSFIRENILKIVFFIVFFVILIIVFSIFFGKGGSSKINTYSDMENYLLSAGKKYYNDNKKLLPNSEDEENKINLDTLVNEGYIKELSALEDENVKCNGYIESKMVDKDYKYVPYLKCGKYYETQTLSDYIINHEKIVNSGDGLYKMGDTYVFKGENPNNFVMLGDKAYRIIQIQGDVVELISLNTLNMSLVWDNRYNVQVDRYYGINDYSKSRLIDLFDTAFKYNTEDFNLFNNVEREKMTPQDVCIGKRSFSNGSINSSNECKTIQQNQKISLITVSDYARASVDPNCKTIYSRSCNNYNYLSRLNTMFETITATSDNTYEVFVVNNGVAELVNASNTFYSNIVIFLDKSSLYSSGDGTDYTPYLIR